jgi:vanillate O-demethylase monooxygenase subunit
MLDTVPAPFYEPYLVFTGNTDRKQQYEVRYPSNALIKAFFCPAGTGGEGRPLHPDTFLMDSYNFLTPIDEGRTRYFWFQQRNVAPNDENVSRRFAASVRSAFEEDKVILAAVQRGMDEMRTPNINLRSDTGGTRFRRRLAQMIEAEQRA